MFFKKKKTVVSLVSPITGTSVSLDQVPDPAFAQGFIGDGVAINPTQGVLVSPCDGIVAHMIDTYHSCIIGHDSGVEVLMHIGVNTVELKGEGFKPLIKTGDQVKQGQPLIEFDMDFIQSKGYPIITPVIMANAEVVENLTKSTGEMKAGESKVLEVQVK
ncbi:PTS glucose transporter subunit IIA [Paenibacillus selenitireducens]|uniref:PTS glucose transporter subunit IIA n=1 Tax=Paenibacillus selenitireducens TaxID=1324314 RepID=A0A1T2XJU5_9BACL|nr:PTS glucose transporter subunit IIA [Paenibacillus selenitireducens]OPA80088.1 PTS glucose transporter subunit IIA [Paenibacillus selenitireducens]